MRSRINRSRNGSVVQDKRDKVWRFYWWENGKRRSRALGRFSTKVEARKASKPLRDELEKQSRINTSVPTVEALIEQYRREKMPRRLDTNRGYESWISVHILPKW